LTDGAGEFVSYLVGVSSIALTQENGVVINVLPEYIQVDFAQYQGMTELVVSTQVPVGVYTGVSVGLDYTDVDVKVENDQGDIVDVNVLVDENGTSLDQVDVQVDVPGVMNLNVTQGSCSHVDIDFDLEQSHGVTYDNQGGVTVVVAPYVTVSVNQESLKTLRLRGTLGSVSTNPEAFTMNLKPFFFDFDDGFDEFGRISVTTTHETTFDINGQTLIGTVGLETLGDIGEGTPVIVKGALKFNPYRFESSTVYAGTSVPSMDRDFVTGIVINVDEVTVAVCGMLYIQDEHGYYYNSSVDVTVSPDTLVKTQTDGGLYTIGDMYSGQFVLISGDLTGHDGQIFEMDASQGTVWIQVAF